MQDDIEGRIRERAYALWEKEGSPHGRDLEFWERARLLIEAESAIGSSRRSAPPATRDTALDQAIEETFPASDPPSATASRGTGKP